LRFFTADTHFYHESIIEYDNRPYKSVEEMNESLIENWNGVVSNSDIIYHLGDFCWRPSMAKEILSRLNGDLHLIRGNHDTLNREVLEMFVTVSDIKRIKIDGTRIYLCHYALRTWAGNDKGTWCLYGHSHGKLKMGKGNTCDVGSNCWNYTPVSFETLKDFMKQKGEKHVKGV